MCSGKNQNSTIVEILDVFLTPNSTIKLRVDNSSLKPKLRVDNQFCFKKFILKMQNILASYIRYPEGVNDLKRALIVMVSG